MEKLLIACDFDGTITQHDTLHLIVEIKGYRQGDAQAKADTMRSLWVPAVNNHGALGRWAFLEIRDIYEATKEIRAYLDRVALKQAAE